MTQKAAFAGITQGGNGKGIISLILANGTALVPLLVLTLSVLSSRLTSELMTANKLILSVAGVVALPAILDD